MFENKLRRIYGRRGENNKMEEITQQLEIKTQLCDSIRNAGLAYPIHNSSTFPLSAVTELSLGLHEVHKFRPNLQQNLLNYNQIIEQGERSKQLRQMIQNQYLIQTVSSHLQIY